MKILQFDSIKDVPANLWVQLSMGRSLAFSREFWETIEKSKLNDFNYQHIVLVDDNEQPLLITSFYTITTDIAIFAPKGLRALLTAIRRVFPGFLKWRILECGTPITVSSPPFITSENTELSVALRELHAHLHKSARQRGCLIIVIRDFEANANRELSLLNKLGYESLPLLPNTYLEIHWQSIAAYHESLKSYYRSKLKKHLKRNLASGVHHRRISSFDEFAGDLCRQWLVVHHQADEFQREVLTPAFYESFSNQLGDCSQAILFFKNDVLIGHALLLLDGQLLRWLYFGRNVAQNDSLYLYVVNSVIEAAIELGAQKLEMGVTTYSVKQDVGAQPSPINVALRAASPLLAPFVAWGYRLMNKPPLLQKKNVFKSGSSGKDA